jgi:small subunit ribosomal protein S6
MHRYETLFVLHPDVAAPQVDEVIERVRGLIESMDGTVDGIESWGSRDLAYAINKQKRGTYIVALYTANSPVVNELERTMKLGDDYLRFVTVRLPKGYATRKPASPSPSAEGPEPKQPGETPAQVD